MTTKKRQPIVPILAEMMEPLQRLCNWAAVERRQRLFVRDFYRPFRNLCEELGYGKRSHPHLLRHSRATHLLQDGVSLFSVARLLGDTVATVERVYGHHSHTVLAQELARVSVGHREEARVPDFEINRGHRSREPQPPNAAVVGLDRRFPVRPL